MPAFRKFLVLSGRDQQILVKACLFLTVIRLGLWIVPFRTLQSILKRLFRCPGISKNESPPPEKVVWSVRAASWYIPSATCLAQALTVQTLLAQEGIHSDLAIGVAREEKSGIKAHAWLEIDGRVIIGEQERDHYTQLTRKG
jgi:hypothetical protein